MGNKKDVLLNADIPERENPDNVTNPQGSRLLDFLSDVNCCILNGCTKKENNDFTSAAPHKGNAVVNYFICRINDYNDVKDLCVINCLDLVATNKWEQLVNDRSRIPDHNLMSMDVNIVVRVRENIND